MKLIFTSLFFILSTLTLHANSIENKEFFSRVLPLEQYIIKSTVSGEIIYANTNIEGKLSNNNIIIEIDKELDILELKQLKRKSIILDTMINIETNNYQRISNISSKSEFEKDNQNLKVLNLKSSKTDLQIKIHTLENKIKHKILKEKRNYIYSIAIKKGDYVNPGSVLYTAHDLSKAKLEIFIPIEDTNIILNKKIFINNKETKYKINKIYKVADIKHISTYKCEIIINRPKQFSQLYKVQFK